ncbi:hypothetical protein SCHPADRAFT_377677 [Schizopora paradoxa]|uniref:Uncharacterized protein n=1 Tax=Schizopora paradoxa TaxID=27342 RepID=A0A0H2RNN2_9AGAM|nr:hypothetical protein SCHPADRAFT_377677 [Schizopora paradoxa]
MAMTHSVLCLLVCGHGVRIVSKAIPHLFRRIAETRSPLSKRSVLECTTITAATVRVSELCCPSFRRLSLARLGYTTIGAYFAQSHSDARYSQ